ncbi:MAG: hypothetical protein WD794_06705 [Mycobacteriales bacterium]
MTPRRRCRRSGPAYEAGCSLALGLLLAVLVRRPQELGSSVPGDPRDPVLLSWVLAWPGHALTSADRLWDGNIFAPLDNTLAFTDLLLGYLPFGLVGEGPAAALVRYNLVLLFTGALAFAGTWLLVRQLGLGRAAALVAATAFAFNPWRVSQLNHIQVLSSGGIPLALALLARGHGVRLRTGTGPLRPGWAFAGWAVATWQLSLGFGLGLQLAYLLALCTAVAAARALVRAQRGKGRPDRRLVLADVAGVALLLAVGATLAQPYFSAVQDHPQARRGLEEVGFYSPSAAAFVTAPGDSLLWGRYTAAERDGVGGINEKALFPGLTVTVLAAAGLLPGPWSRRRVVLIAGAVAVVAVCAMGTSGPAGGRWSYLLLYEYAPGWQGVRTPSRLVTTAWLGLALLAAHGVAVLLAMVRRARGWADPALDRPLAVGLALGLSAAALLEGLDTAGQTAVRPPPALALTALPQPVLVLPSEDSTDQDVMLWSTDGFPRVVNGVSGFTPAELEQLREAAARLPDPPALARLRSSGVASLLVLPDALPGTRYERLDAVALARLPGVDVEPQGDVLVVRLGRGP